MKYRQEFNKHGLYTQESEQRKTYKGYTIDSKNARILDDGFMIKRRKGGGYIIEYYIADTALFFSSMGEKPHFPLPEGKHSTLDISDFQKHCSLTNGKPKPAIRIAFEMNKDMDIVSPPSISRVLFQNIWQMNTETYEHFKRRKPEEASLHHECATKIGKKYTNKDIDTSTPISTLSTLVNGQLTAYCNQYHLPIIHQTRFVYIKGLRDTFFTLERAQEAALKAGIIKQPEDLIYGVNLLFSKTKQAKPYPIESTTTKSQYYARFTSPMKSLYEAINIQILCAHLDKMPTPYTVKELEMLISTIDEKTAKKDHKNNKKRDKKRPRLR